MTSEIQNILQTSRTIAVVGVSSKKWRPSHGVTEYMQHQNYRILPVNPHETEVLGEKAYPSLKALPEKVDIVNIFRRSEHVATLVEEAIAIGARAIWMQEGVIDEEAARRASGAGLVVIMDRCILKEHRKLIRASDTSGKNWQAGSYL